MGNPIHYINLFPKLFYTLSLGAAYRKVIGEDKYYLNIVIEVLANLILSMLLLSP